MQIRLPLNIKFKYQTFLSLHILQNDCMEPCLLLTYCVSAAQSGKVKIEKSFQIKNRN